MENNITPFFSIVIPTKNRSELLKDAIQSVLWQNFTDFELIVSDNFNEQVTQEVIADFSNHPKFRFVRTEHELNMIDHWEFATKHALGKYVLVLADRKVLYQNALKKIAKTIKKFPDINAFSFGVQTYNETTNRMGWNNAIGKTTVYQTKDLINNFLNANYFSSRSLDCYFPKTLNGCFKNDFAKTIRSLSGNYFNNSGVTTPDYSSFFINCALNAETVYIGKKLILTQGEQASNGRIFGAGNFHNYMNSLNLNDPYHDVEIKAPLIYNLLITDFINIKKVFARNLLKKEVNFLNYYFTNYFEILIKIEQGLYENDKNYFLEQWIKAIQLHIPKLNSEKIIEEVNLAFQLRNKPLKWDKIRRFSYHLIDFLSLRFKDKSLMNRIIIFKYNDIFHAAGFKF